MKEINMIIKIVQGIFSYIYLNMQTKFAESHFDYVLK